MVIVYLTPFGYLVMENGSGITAIQRFKSAVYSYVIDADQFSTHTYFLHKNDLSSPVSIYILQSLDRILHCYNSNTSDCIHLPKFLVDTLGSRKKEIMLNSQRSFIPKGPNGQKINYTLPWASVRK